jgi:hypothetical protein
MELNSPSKVQWRPPIQNLTEIFSVVWRWNMRSDREGQFPHRALVLCTLATGDIKIQGKVQFCNTLHTTIATTFIREYISKEICLRKRGICNFTVLIIVWAQRLEVSPVVVKNIYWSAVSSEGTLAGEEAVWRKCETSEHDQVRSDSCNHTVRSFLPGV